MEPHWNPIVTKPQRSASRTLTARFIESAKFDTRRDLRDDRVTGLILRVSSSGQKSWSVIYRRKIDGHRRRFTIGQYPAFSLEQARNEARQLIAAVARGTDPASEAKRVQRPVTFHDLIDKYIEQFAKLNKKSAVLYDDRLKLRKDVLPAIGAMPLVDIQKRHVLGIVNNIMGRGAGVTANRTLALIKAILNWAVAEDVLAHNPAAGVRPRVEEKPRDRVLTDLELREVWHGLDACSMSTPLRLAIRLSIVTGQRIGAIVGMTRSELELVSSDPSWTVRGNRTKNGELSRVPLSNLAICLVREALTLSRHPEAVFPSPKGDGSIRSKAATRAVTRARPNIAVEHFTTHDFRRTCASGMARLGVSPFIISLVLDHASATSGSVTNSVYVKYSYDREKREALALWAKHLHLAVLSPMSQSTIPGGQPRPDMKS